MGQTAKFLYILITMQLLFKAIAFNCNYISLKQYLQGVSVIAVRQHGSSFSAREACICRETPDSSRVRGVDRKYILYVTLRLSVLETLLLIDYNHTTTTSTTTTTTTTHQHLCVEAHHACLHTISACFG
jgi:hypothetical protein